MQALKEMRACNIEVLLCSAPLMSSAYCAQEKVAWVRKNLGELWLSRLILTCEKNGMKGDILIDDKPIQSMREASFAHPEGGNGIYFASTWTQIIFDMPYNRPANRSGMTSPDGYETLGCHGSLTKEDAEMSQNCKEEPVQHWGQWQDVLLPMIGMDRLTIA